MNEYVCDFVRRAPGGELQMVLDRDEILEERQVAKLLREILDGVAFLHSLNVAHLDIKVRRTFAANSLFLFLRMYTSNS